ncbi:MAG TPA: PilW family protein [Pseudomonas sp.]|nr:PilW family protein [Pseudomonas sp.]
MNPREHRQRSRQRGFSLVELLVAFVISMLLLTGVIQVFFASKQTYASNEAASRLQENGRFALEFIAQSARHAGYVQPDNNADKPSPIAKPGDISCDSNNNEDDACSNDGDNAAADIWERSDRTSFIFQPRLGADDKRRDCNGNEIANNNALILNQFFIAPPSAITPPYDPTLHPPLTLNCRSLIFNSNSKGAFIGVQSPLIEGIDALQIQYGLSEKSSDLNNVSQYISAERVTALNKWSNVTAIRIAVLANSVERTNPPTPARAYVLLDAAPIVIDDGRARQVFTTTIKLRNNF